MKLTRWMLVGLCLSVMLSGPAVATLIAFDNFDYNDGSLVPNGGWANHSGVSGDLLISDGQAIVQHGAPSEDAHISFDTTAGLIYYGLDFLVAASVGISGTDNEYFAHFKDNGFNFAARLDIVAATGGGDFKVGIATDDSTADMTWGTDFSFDTIYRAVVEYDQNTNIASLWIDATTITDTFIMGDDQADPGDTITQFALRQSDSSHNESIRVDNLVIGTTFGDVVNPYVTSIPEPTTLAIFGIGLAGIGFARRRKA